MVALAQQFAFAAERTLRFFARHHTHGLGSALCSKLNVKANLRRLIYDGCEQLESCSRDPILYEGSRWNLYQYVDGRPLVAVDFSGLNFTKPLYCHGVLTQHTYPSGKTSPVLEVCEITCVCPNGDMEYPQTRHMMGPNLSEREYRKMYPYLPYPGTWDDQCDEFADMWANEEICECGGGGGK